MKYANTWLTPYTASKLMLFLSGTVNPTEQEIYDNLDRNGLINKSIISEAIDFMYIQTFGYVVSDENFKSTLMKFATTLLGPILVLNSNIPFNTDVQKPSYNEYLNALISGEITINEIMDILKWSGTIIGMDIVNNHMTFLKAFIENVNYYNYITSQGANNHELTSEYEGKPTEKAVISRIEPINDNINQSQTESIIAKGTTAQGINEMLYNGPAWYKAMGSYATEMNMDWLKESINKIFVEVY